MNVKTLETLSVIDPRVEFSRNPLGVDELKPRFSWIPVHSDRGQNQKAYRVIVSSSMESAEKGIGDVWDSGVVESDSNIVEYSGPQLKSFTRYFWRVKWWDGNGRESKWSEVVWFETAILDSKEWRGAWIGGGQLFRKEFTIEKDIAEARIYIAGLGYYELRVNGVKVGNKALDPPWSEYDKTIYYSVYDVTDLIKKGLNVIAVMLGRGRYSQKFRKVKYYDEPKLLMMIRIAFKDGGVEYIYTDESWKCLEKGPIVDDDIYRGFKYDERLEPYNWDKQGFDDSSWRNCLKVSPPRGALRSSAVIPSTKAVATIKPREVYNPKPGVYIYDFGQNITGWVRLKVKCFGECEVKIRYAELINADYTLHTKNLRGADATDVFVLKGYGEKIVEPCFTYHGFRYAEVSGISYPPSIDDIEAVVISADLEPIGSFVCSSKMINDIHRLCIWSLRNNLNNGVQTDCPQRAERMGWLGDAWLSSDSAILNFNMVKYYEKIVRDIMDSQKEDGSIPDVVPPFWEFYPADPAWGTALIYIPWVLYVYYGDKRIIEEVYESAKKWWSYLYSRSKDGVLYFGKYGDWVPPGRVRSVENSPFEIVSTWILLRDAKILREMAKVLNRIEDAGYFDNIVRSLTDSFNKAFLHGEGKSSGYCSEYKAGDGSTICLGNSQTCLALPLAEDIVPSDRVEHVVSRLVKSVKNEWDKHFNVGIIGLKYVPEVLAKYGYTQLVYEALMQDTYPSFGYMIKESATTLWERWEKLTGSAMNSHDHHMFGSIDAWLYRWLAGLQVVEPGFKRFRVLIPDIQGLNSVSTSIYTIRGLVSISWHKDDEKSLIVELSIPVNSVAELIIPRKSGAEIYEGETLIWKNTAEEDDTQGVISIRELNDKIVLEIGSGKYRFTIKWSG
ncbi:MAG: family 78 glycoside hydrolase catalytic domain [Ignisphaera sp.]|uniref:alpha-L-rhamnosidase n=1 Tax=Ignisphaera aggregans TaxID=334771 RepID=A0A7C4JKA3_9CREN